MRGHQVQRLKHEPDSLVANVRQLIFRQRGDVGAAQEIASSRRPVEAPDDIHQGRLSGTGGPHDGQHLSSPNRKRDAAQRMDCDLTSVVNAVNLVEPDNGVRGPDAAWRRGVRIQNHLSCPAFLTQRTPPCSASTLRSRSLKINSPECYA